jgi:hypothetical protein
LSSRAEPRDLQVFSFAAEVCTKVIGFCLEIIFPADVDPPSFPRYWVVLSHPFAKDAKGWGTLVRAYGGSYSEVKVEAGRFSLLKRFPFVKPAQA